MKQLFYHSIWDTHALLVARILMGGMFLLSGIQKFQGIDGVAGYIASAGLPAPLALAWIVAVFEVLAGAAIILGKYFREAAILLAVFVVIVSFPFHGPGLWETDITQQIFFTKNTAILAGLLFMAAHGPGRTWRLK